MRRLASRAPPPSPPPSLPPWPSGPLPASPDPLAPPPAGALPCALNISCASSRQRDRDCSTPCVGVCVRRSIAKRCVISQDALSRDVRAHPETTGCCGPCGQTHLCAHMQARAAAAHTCSTRDGHHEHIACGARQGLIAKCPRQGRACITLDTRWRPCLRPFLSTAPPGPGRHAAQAQPVFTSLSLQGLLSTGIGLFAAFAEKNSVICKFLKSFSFEIFFFSQKSKIDMFQACPRPHFPTPTSLFFFFFFSLSLSAGAVLRADGCDSVDSCSACLN